jgi:hypothetical protein
MPAHPTGISRLTSARRTTYRNHTATDFQPSATKRALGRRIVLILLAPRPGLEPGTYGLTVLGDFDGFVLLRVDFTRKLPHVNSRLLVWVLTGIG